MPRRSEAKSTVRQTDFRESTEQILIVIEGEDWFIRHVYFIEHKLDLSRKLYHCDRNLGGPFGSIEDAVKAAKEILHGAQRSAAIALGNDLDDAAS